MREEDKEDEEDEMRRMERRGRGREGRKKTRWHEIKKNVQALIRKAPTSKLCNCQASHRHCRQLSHASQTHFEDSNP